MGPRVLGWGPWKFPGGWEGPAGSPVLNEQCAPMGPVGSLLAVSFWHCGSGFSNPQCCSPRPLGKGPSGA